MGRLRSPVAHPANHWITYNTNPAPIPVNLGTERPILFDHRGTPIRSERPIGYKLRDKGRSGRE